MTSNNKVIWHEGLFLEPQHFQQQVRYVEYLVEQRDELRHPFHWGFVELVLDESLKNIGKIGLKSCVAIFPDGTFYHAPGVDELPPVIDVPNDIQDEMLYLGLPLRRDGVAESSCDAIDNKRHLIQSTEISNSIVNNGSVVSVDVALLTPKIFVGKHKLEQYTLLPICKIAEHRPGCAYMANPNFIPSCLHLKASPLLIGYLKEIRGLLYHRGQMLSERLTDTKAAGTAEVVDFILLQMINRYESLAGHLLCQASLHPESLFQFLLTLLGEMSTFTCDKRRPEVLPEYRHACLYESFHLLMTALREAMSRVLEQNAFKVELNQVDLNTWVGQIDDKKMLTSCRFILAVHVDISSEELRTLLPKQIKIAPVESIADFVKRSLPGISIVPLSSVPRQIPYYNQYTYFEINTQHELWRALTISKGLAIHVSSSLKHLKFELWAIRGA